jgi:N-acetylneuraminate lyase
VIHGIFPALLTPLDGGKTVNHESLRKLMNFHIDSGVDGFFVCGGSGEGVTLETEERKAVMETAVEVARGRAQIIAHVGGLNTEVVADLAAHAASLGVDAVAAVPPFYFRVDIDALYDHYKAIADAANGTPVHLYNVPSSTHVEINAAIMKRLMEIPTVRGIKYSSYNLFDMRNIIELSPDMVVLSGFDEVCIAALSMGAQGAIGSTYNVLPASFSVIYREMKAGNLAEAQKWQFRANRVIKALVSVPLIAGLKEILTDWGIDCGIPRQPQRPLTADERARLFAAIDEAGLVQLEADARAHLAASK